MRFNIVRESVEKEEKVTVDEEEGLEGTDGPTCLSTCPPSPNIYICIHSRGYIYVLTGVDGVVLSLGDLRGEKESKGGRERERYNPEFHSALLRLTNVARIPWATTNTRPSSPKHQKVVISTGNCLKRVLLTPFFLHEPIRPFDHPLPHTNSFATTHCIATSSPKSPRTPGRTWGSCSPERSPIRHKSHARHTCLSSSSQIRTLDPSFRGFSKCVTNLFRSNERWRFHV